MKSLSWSHRLYLFKRYFHILLPFHFAHHPLCSNYKEEILHIGRWFICRGCIETYSSALVALIITVGFNPFYSFSLSEIFLIVLCITLPTWFGLFYSLQNRKLKDFIRISLGLGWGIALAEIWLQPLWIDKITIFFIMIIFLFVFQKFRRIHTRKKPVNLCVNCIEFNDDACLGFKAQFEAERLYSREISDFLQQKLSWDEIKAKLQPSPTFQVEN
ncbi:MAG: hypothetical protein ACFFB2_00715 [Promethearchaeota archaeon]